MQVCVLAGNASTSHETHAAIAKALTAVRSLDLMERVIAEHQPAFTEPFASIVATSLGKHLMRSDILQDWTLMHISAALLRHVGTYPDEMVSLSNILISALST
jgi:pyruvoyl-dependent arginine decarboxylase (PvlArgDC)